MSEEHLSRIRLSEPVASGAQRPADLAERVPVLVARVFEESPPAERGRLLEHLLRPLGLLSLAAIANGLFAKIACANGWSRLSLSTEDVKQVGVTDVMELVHHVQQVSTQAMDSLAKLVSASPVLAGSAAAAMLLAALRAQAKSRAPVVSDDFDPL